MSDSSRLPHRLAVALVFGAAFLCCLPAVDAPFTFDEQAGIEDNRVVHPGASFAEALRYRYSPDQGRPVFFASLLLDADLWGMKPRGFRLTGFLLHLACGAILYVLLRRLHGAGTVTAKAAPAALAGTALFLLHPLQSESVLYIWGRSEIQSTLFGLLAVLLALAADDRKAGPGTDRRRLLWAGALSCLMLALASKEEAVAIPLIFFIWWRWVEGRPARPGALRAAVLGLPVAVFLIWRGSALGEIGRQVYARSVTENLLGQGTVTLRMLRLFLLPLGQSIDHPAEVPGVLIGTLAIAACVVMVGWAAFTVRARPRIADASIATGTSTVALIAAGVLVAAAATAIYWLVPLPDLLCERRAYLPLAGAENELLAALQIEPRDPRALTNLGEVLRATARAPAAVTLYREALDADPTHSHAAARLGVTLENLGDRQGALAAYREFLARGTSSPTDQEAVLKKVQALEQAPGGATPTR